MARDSLMVDINGSSEGVRHISVALSHVDGLAVLPTVAAQAVDKVRDPQRMAADLCDVISACPALTVALLRLAADRHINVKACRYSFSHLIGRLPVSDVRRTILQSRPYQPPRLTHLSPHAEVLSRQDLVVHSLAVAECARQLAKRMVVGTDENLAYMAGLLHDVGKLALHEVMPKGFCAMVGQARIETRPLEEVERSYLGTDHSEIGRRLAQKWHLPHDVRLSIWLHHSVAADRGVFPAYVQTARIVYSADIMVRSLHIGDSGSVAEACPWERIAGLLHMDERLVHDLYEQLEILIEPKLDQLRLDMEDPMGALCHAAMDGAAHLERHCIDVNAKLSRLEGVEHRLEFVTAFFSEVDWSSPLQDIAKAFACRWQRFFQTGKLCLYWGDRSEGDLFEAVLVEDLQHCRVLLLEGPAELPRHRERWDSLVHDIEDGDEWIFDELVDIEFARHRCKKVSWMVNDDFQAALIFEQNYPTSEDRLQEAFEAAIQVGRVILGQAAAREHQTAMTNDWVQLARRMQDIPVRSAEDSLLEALAEMAAGFAHELNNPLSVISGRAQLLAETESEQDKQRALHQIQENAREVAARVDDLISFADPPAPKPTRTSIAQLIDEAVQLARYTSGRDNLSVTIETDTDIETVNVDSGQMASALANVLINAADAYQDTLGPIHIHVGPAESGGYAVFHIRDEGCGMDDRTLKKATTPFFSAKTAGRKRGLGLSYAARVTRLNHGALTIKSRLGEGTEVSLILPA